MSTLKRRLQVLVLVAAHAALANAAAAPPNWRTQAAEALMVRVDATSLAAAAALAYPKSATALDLAARASELAPQSAAIGWLRLALCADTPSCDIRDVATVLRWVDANNGAAWLPTLAAAQRDKDATEIDRVLADMARGTRFDLYSNRIVVLMSDALYRVRHDLRGAYPASDSARLSALNNIAGAEIIPSFTPLVDACRESVSAPERRETCLKVSKTMQRGDTIVAQMAGFGIERRLWAPDTREARAIGERKRILEWRVTTAAQFDSPILPWMKNARARARLAQMRAMPREEDVCIAVLKEHKMAIDPPEEHR